VGWGEGADGSREGRPGWIGKRRERQSPEDQREEGNARNSSWQKKESGRKDLENKGHRGGRGYSSEDGERGALQTPEKSRRRVLTSRDEDGNTMAICLVSELKIQKEGERIGEDVSFLLLKVKVFCHQ
jgi:hypothetical protein